MPFAQDQLETLPTLFGVRQQTFARVAEESGVECYKMKLREDDAVDPKQKGFMVVVKSDGAYRLLISNSLYNSFW